MLLPYERNAREHVAELLGVSERAMLDARLLKRAAPDLAEKVKTGTMSLTAATKERKARKRSGG